MSFTTESNLEALEQVPKLKILNLNLEEGARYS